MRAAAPSAARERRPSPRRPRTALAQRLRERRAEIEAAVLTRVCALEDPKQTGDPAYVEGLRAAVGHAVAYALEAIERNESRPAPIPTALFAQARHAAREGVSLDTVLRRYLAGYTLLCDFLHRAAEETGLMGEEAFGQLRRDQAALLDRLLAAIAEEYGREPDPWRRSSAQRRAELVRRILAGELLDGTELGYELGGWHLGVVAQGPGAPKALRRLASSLDRRLLLVRPGGQTVWGWLGGSRKLAADELAERDCGELEGGMVAAIGEPGAGLSGWRLSHRQAKAALPVALRGASNVVSYCDVAILAAALGDEVLASSLSKIYLAPLERESDGGAELRRTLAAYLHSGRNASSAAAALKVNRNTVGIRLRAAEERIGRPLEACAAELETALRLQELAQRERVELRLA